MTTFQLQGIIYFIACLQFVGMGHSATTSLVKVSTAATTETQLQVRDPRCGTDASNCGKVTCKKGEFWKTEDFLDIHVITQILNAIEAEYLLSDSYCQLGSILFNVISVLGRTYKLEDFCRCDCLYGHGASKSRICVNEAKYKGPVQCLCEYTETDKKRIPCYQDLLLNYEQPGKIFLGGVTQETFTENTTQLNLPRKDETCEEIFHAVIKIVCTVDGGEPVTEINNYKIYESDLCSIDCYYSHGARFRSPYGFCVVGNEISTCVCIY